MIQPGELSAKNVSLNELLRIAFGVKGFQVTGVSSEFNGLLFDVDAKASKSVADEMKKLDEFPREKQNQRWLKHWLESRMHLKFHLETKDMPIYSLRVVESGKLHEAKVDCDSSGPQRITQNPGKPLTPPCGTVIPGLGSLAGNTVT